MEKSGLETITFHQRTHSPWYKSSLNGHKKNTFSTGIMIEHFSVLYVDDGALPFGNRSQLEQLVELIYSHFTKFGLEMHIGREGKPLKTECVFPPPLASSSNVINFLLQTREQVTNLWRNKSRGGSHKSQSAGEKMVSTHISPRPE